MQKPQGYDETVLTAGFDQLSTGGHYLTILGAKEENLNGYDVLTIQFDTHSTDHQPKYYQDDYARRMSQWPDSKYQGVHRIFLPTGSPEDDKYKWSLKSLKGFITSVEESNTGFKFDWNNPALLKGKSVGGVFGEEEYQGQDGIKTTVRLRYFVSNDSVPGAKAPKTKTLKPESRATLQEASDLPFEL